MDAIKACWNALVTLEMAVNLAGSVPQRVCAVLDKRGCSSLALICMYICIYNKRALVQAISICIYDGRCIHSHAGLNVQSGSQQGKIHRNFCEIRSADAGSTRI
jgi:hypothetical protein